MRPFDAVLTREFPHRKPHPGPVLHILAAFGVRPERCLVVGDCVHDIASGRAAGARTCFFRNAGVTDYGAQADFAVATTRDLERVLFSAAAPLRRAGEGAGA